MSARRTRFYLDKRNAKFLGVCSGIADYTGFDITLVRIGMVLATVLGSGIMMIVYLVAAWVAEDKPFALRDEDADTKQFWQKARVAPGRSIRDVNATYRDVDRRLRDIETYVTSSNRGLAAEIDQLK